MEETKRNEIMALSLEEKIDYSKKVIKQALEQFSSDELFIAWTGGKDSTVNLWLYKQVCEETGTPLPRTMFIDEGSVFEEILELVDLVKKKWNVTVMSVTNSDVSDKAKNIGDPIKVTDLNQRNQDEIARLDYHEETFPFDPESFVGNHLMKTVVMNTFMQENKVKALSTAIRFDEQEARLEEEFFSPRTSPDHTRVHSILHLTERDIWNIIHQYNLPFCSLYHLGYRSLGAKCSTTKNSDIPAWEQDLENTTERAGRGQDKEEIMDQLRSLGYM